MVQFEIIASQSLHRSNSTQDKIAGEVSLSIESKYAAQLNVIVLKLTQTVKLQIGTGKIGQRKGAVGCGTPDPVLFMLRIDRKELAAHVVAHGREVALTGKGDDDDLHLALGFLLSHGGPGEIKRLRRVLSSIWGSQGGARNLFPRQATRYRSEAS